MKAKCHADQISLVIRLAWEDRTSFEEIKERTGLREQEVIDIMRRELKPSSFTTASFFFNNSQFFVFKVFCRKSNKDGFATWKSFTLTF